MSDYDFVLSDLEIMKADLTEEKLKLSGKGGSITDGNERQKLNARPVSAIGGRSVNASSMSMGAHSQAFNGIYSEDGHYNDIVSGLEDLDVIPDPPEKAKNAFAITLFCMEAAFDSRSKDFLKYAFDRFPDRDYLIVT